MLDQKFFDDLKEKILHYFEETGGHEFEHTERVYKLAIHIAQTEKADLDILRAAALLHDIARKKQEDMNDTICHAKEGGKMAKEILEKSSFPKEKIDAVSYAIEAHRYSKNIKPETTEAAIIQDGDRLEALGSIAIARIFSYNGKRNIKIHDPKVLPKEEYGVDQINSTAINHFHEKIFKIKPETFNTKTGKEMARDRYEFTKEYVDRFMKEWEGKE
jgi:uncharacterized protein